MNDLRLNLEQAMEYDYDTLIKCLLLIYNRQTEDEQQSGDTHHHNRIGFTGPDAKRLTYYAKWIKSGRTLDGKFLADCRKRMKKYSGQLIKLREEMRTIQNEQDNRCKYCLERHGRDYHCEEESEANED